MTAIAAPAPDAPKKIPTSSRDIVRAIKKGARDIIMVDPFQVVVIEGFNCRDFELPGAQEELDALARDIAANGVMKPIHVFGDPKDGKVKLTDGERRLRATKIAIEKYQAAIESIPAIVDPANQNVAERTASQARHNMGRPFTPMEKGQLVQKLLNFGWSADTIAEKTGYSKASQAQYLKTIELPEEMKTLVQQDRLAASEALRVVQQAPSQEAAVKEIEERAKVADAKGSKRIMAKHSTSPKLTPAKAKKAAADIFTEVLAAGKVDKIKEKDEVIVRFSSDEYDRFVAYLKG